MKSASNTGGFRWDNLSPSAQKAILAGLASAIGGSVGAYAAGKRNRLSGALVGAGLSGGLALASPYIGSAVSSVASKLSPPPKSNWEGIPGLAAIGSVPVLGSLAFAHAGMPMGSTLQQSIDEAFKNKQTDVYREVANGQTVKPQLTDWAKNLKDRLRNAGANRSGGILGEIKGLANSIRVRGNIAAELENKGIIPDKLFMKIRSRPAYRRGFGYTGAALSTLALADLLYRKYKANRSSSARGWT